MARQVRKSRTTFWGDFKKFFLRGLGILLPSVLSLALLWWAYGFLQQRVAEPINGAVRQTILVAAPPIFGPQNMPDWYQFSESQLLDAHAERERLGLTRLNDAALRSRLQSDSFRQWWMSHWYMQAIGFIVALTVVYLAGVLVGNLIGRTVFTHVERLLTRLPLLKQVYPSVKQVVEFLLGGGASPLPSNRVVVVEYPRKGIWSIGLMTGETMRSIEQVVGVECVTIFIPSSPTPFTGYTITVPSSSVYELPVTLDEALRFVVSGGVLVPPTQAIKRNPAVLKQAPGRDIPSMDGGSDLAEASGD